MAITPAQRNRILQLEAWGHAPAAIAARLMLRWQDVAAVLGDDGETSPAAEGGGTPPPCGPSHQGSLLSDPGGSDRPMRAAPPAPDTREDLSGTARKAPSTQGERGPVQPVVGAAGRVVGVQPAGPQQQPGEAQSGASPRGKASRPRVDLLAESEAVVRRSPASAPQPRGVPGRAVLPEDLLSAGRPLAMLRGRR